MVNFKTGIPSKRDYEKLDKTDYFNRLEEFSNQFLKSHHDTLKDYTKKWVKDPLHQWSRQWEYPFTLERLLPILQSKDRTVEILDAGSGVTFFPYYLKSIGQESATIRCCDYDETLRKTYHLINQSEKNKVLFDKADLHNLPYESNSFDAIYCISVLEHTKNYREIIQEFRRILKPEGSLVLTFDISIDGTEDISIEKANELVEELRKHFQTGEEIRSIKKELIGKDAFTTYHAKRLDTGLLPWKTSITSKIKALLKNRKGSTIPLLTFYCIGFSKPR